MKSPRLLNGGCACGNIQVTISLPSGEDISESRTCDCEFCRSYSASYISNPVGQATSRVREASRTEKLRQGTASAYFLVCSDCRTLVSANYEGDGKLYSSVNVACVDQLKDLRATVVSPRLLTREQKTDRWRASFFRSRFAS